MRPYNHFYTFGGILFFLLLQTLNVQAQDIKVHYYMPDSANKTAHQLFATVGDSTYQLLKNPALCYGIEDVRDYNNDGIDDALVEIKHGCGSDCCGSSYFFFSYNKGQFHRTKAIGYVWNSSPGLKKWKDRWSVLLLVSANYKKESSEEVLLKQFILDKDSLVVVYKYRPNQVDSLSEEQSSRFDTLKKKSDKPIGKNTALPNDSQEELNATGYFFYYKVKKKGESLSTIAYKHKTTVDAIKSLNGKISTRIKIGETLQIPKRETANFYIHVVLYNETLWSISNKYKIPVEKIRAANNLSDNAIQFGKILIVPKG